nr:hypothetical protein [Tanacetum cinerariifolium]
ESPFALEAYSDSDYARANKDQKSTSGGCSVGVPSGIAKVPAGFVVFPTVRQLPAGCVVFPTFWSTATLRATELGPPAILAKIDKTPYTITEELVRSHLQLANDGGVADLPILEIYSGIDNLGYVTEGKLTFFKNKFSPYKLFANMRLNFAGHPMPLLLAMLLQAQAGGGAEDVMGKLVKKVKTLEAKLKTKKRKMVVSDSNQEDGTTQNVDLDALQIVPDEDDDVYTEATSLARKVPVVDHQIIQLNNKPRYKIIRADGTHQLYANTLSAAEDEGIFYSGCSRSMTGNKDRMDDFQAIHGGKETFRGGEGRITGKGIIRTPTLDFENVYYVKELQQFNLGNLACLVTYASFDECVEWHRQMAHVNSKNMNSLVKHNLVRGLPSKLFKNGHTCVACCKGKQHKVFYKTIKAVSSISEPLQLLHIDLFGPTSIRSIDHKYYCLVITDDYSRFCWVFFLEHKDETYSIFKNFINLVENQLNKKVKAIRCDNGIEFKNAHIIELYGSKGIKREYSNPRTPQQNRIAERKNKTLIEVAKTMLVDSKLPTMFWTEAVRTACYVLNRVFVTSPHNKTPYALLTGNIPTVSHFKPFGCHVTILNTSDHLGKFDGKADEGYIVGYSASNKAYRVYNVSNKRVEKTINLWFFKDKPNVQGLGHECVQESQPIDTPGDKLDDSPFPFADEIFQKEFAKLKDQEQRVTSDAEELRTPAGVKAVLPGCIPVPTGRVPVPAGSLPVPTVDSMFDGEPTTRFPCPSDLGNHNPSPGIFSSSSYDDEFDTALNNVALADPTWVDTMQEEMQQFKFQNVWVLVDLPLGLHVQRRPDGIFIHQDKYVQEIVYKFDLGNVRIATTPYESPKPKSKSESDSPVNVHLYRSMIGSLMYLTASRPDIIFAVSACSRHQGTPTTFNLEAVKKIFKYLKGQPKLGLWYPKESPLVLEAYSDSDYVGANKDMKSTTGGCEFLGTLDTKSVVRLWHKQSSMATLQYKAEHNKVRYLLKPTESDDYHNIIDFLRSSHIRAPELGPPAILAIINRTPYTIIEELVQSSLQLADDGGVTDLPILKIYFGMDALGYVTEGEGAEVAAQDVPYPMHAPDQSLAHLPTSFRPQSPDHVAPVLEHDHSSAQPDTGAGSFPTTEDVPLGGDFHTSPPRSSYTPPTGQPLGAELHNHKKLFKDVVGKLVKKVKTLEVKLKTKKRKMVVSDSDEEDGTTPNVDLDALRALANAAVAIDLDVPSGSTSQIPTASPCAPSVTLTAASAVPADSPKVPAAILADSPNVPAGVSSKGKSPMVKEDIPVTA